MKKLVFPTDFSEASVLALPVAAQIARTLSLELHLVHVLSPRFQTTNAQYGATLSRLEHSFDELQLQPYLSGIQVHAHVITGTSPADLLNDNRFAKADLIVMSSRGATGLKETLLGSHAEHLIRSASMPVLVLKKAPASVGFKTVVFASDFTDDYGDSVDFLQTLLSKFDNAVIHLLFVNTLSRFEQTSEVKARMDTFAKEHKLDGCTFNLQDDFEIETGLLSFAMEKQADLIVLGTHGRRGLRHLFSGSIAEDVANHASIPVLTLPLKSDPIRIRVLSGPAPGMI
ncbi:universal stress protein [Spirosoma sp. KCTC 42546]|uniref:universal stress protein n=1 Tax=Spirosoma sp. KCTC 42546 TaxID=2520506 RepID=UPI001156E298|nr:universal stress protein [Spirosoma sp. KCTC 42546]QDK79592.1 universal stress protein [Spirosoma sp. KCTC 42546]